MHIYLRFCVQTIALRWDRKIIVATKVKAYKTAKPEHKSAKSSHSSAKPEHKSAKSDDIEVQLSGFEVRRKRILIHLLDKLGDLHG